MMSKKEFTILEQRNALLEQRNALLKLIPHLIHHTEWAADAYKLAKNNPYIGDAAMEAWCHAMSLIVSARKVLEEIGQEPADDESVRSDVAFIGSKI